MKLLLASLVIIFASGIGGVAGPRRLADSGKAQEVDVSIQDLQFTPATITIHVGDKVVWTNNDDRDYNLVCKDAGIASGNIRPGQTFDHVFKKAGTFTLTCKYHPRMKGTITVEQ